MKILGRTVTDEKWDQPVMYLIVAVWGFLLGAKVMWDILVP